MSQTLRPVTTTSQSYSCTGFKNVSELQSIDVILFLDSESTKYKLIKIITEHNASKTPFESNILENVNVHTQDKDKRQARFIETARSIERQDNNIYENYKLSSCSLIGSLWLYDETQLYARKTSRAGLTNNGQERVDTNWSRFGRLAQHHTSISNVTFNKSVHCTCRLKARSKQELKKENNTKNPELANTILQKLEDSTSKALYRTNETNPHSVTKNPPIHSTKELSHLKINHNVCMSTTKVLPEIDYSKHNLKSWSSFCTFSSLVSLQPGSIKEKKKKRDHFLSGDSITTNLSTSTALSLKQYYYAILPEHQLVSTNNNKKQTDKTTVPCKQFRKLNNNDTKLFPPSSAEQSSDDQKRQFKLHEQSRIMKMIIGPFAQTQIVYNVKTADRGTSQVFKQKSQAIGTSSVSSNGTSSTATSGRPAIQIQSSCSFRIEFPGKGSGPVIPVQEEPVAKEGKPKKARKKSLHRCLCTLSFPTDKKKPSAQASQTKKKKITKKEREGKETLVKEKGSESISKYKESIEIKTPPEKKKENPCVKCWKKLWKKDKKDTSKEVKPGLTSTNISLKPDPSSKTDKKAKKKEKKKDKKEEKKKDKKEKKKKDVTKNKEANKKNKALKPYECEPGVCSPKVCVPQVCYDRKFPPPPKPRPPPPSMASTLQKCCRKLQFWKKDAGPSLEAGTQSQKISEAPPAGATVYKDSGAGTKRRKVPKLEAPSDQPLTPAGTPAAKEKGKTKKAKQDQTKTDTSIQPPLGGVEPSPPADYSTGPQFKKQGGFSGVQFYQSYDGGLMTKQQGVNIGSECGCSLEFYKMRF